VQPQKLGKDKLLVDHHHSLRIFITTDFSPINSKEKKRKEKKRKETMYVPLMCVPLFCPPPLPFTITT
jgi:hypothetical protein